MKRARFFALVLLMAAPAAAQIDVGSDGSDGIFNPAVDLTIDLSQAATAPWDTPSPTPGAGVFDPDQWAIVFKYSSVNIPAGVDVFFRNHPSNAPVVWLVQGDVDITGRVWLTGADGHSGSQPAAHAEPGPGGFRGGRGSPSTFNTSSAGFGPGGGQLHASDGNGGGGSYGSLGGGGALAGALYGSAKLVPLFGGSGGAGGMGSTSYSHGGGGGGGGAILIGANNTIFLRSNSILSANGGVGLNGVGSQARYGAGGSGGAIRLVADVIDIAPTNVTLTALGGTSTGLLGGMGRIRIEGNTITPTFPSTPPPSTDAPQPIWPTAATPKVRAVTLNGINIPMNPYGGLVYPFIDVTGQFPASVPLNIELMNIPIASTVTARVTPRIGNAFTVTATYAGGNDTLSTWTTSVSVPTGVSAIQIRAQTP